MSLASEWAAAVASEQAKVATAEAQIPPGYTAGELSATVERGGGLHLNKEIILPPADALRLGQWIVATFG